MTTWKSLSASAPLVLHEREAALRAGGQTPRRAAGACALRVAAATADNRPLERIEPHRVDPHCWILAVAVPFGVTVTI
jgi:hypothetical protein